MNPAKHHLAALLLSAALAAPSAHADDAAIASALKLTKDQHLYRVPRVNTPVKVDAVLDEPVWSKAVVVDVNIEMQPAENVPGPVKTEALLAYDETNLYVAFRCYDPDPAQIRANLRDRDNIFDDDWAGIVFDTFNDERKCHDFFCNPFGVQADGTELNGQGDNCAWDAIWSSAGRITDFGYVVEMAIPFSSLPFQNVEGDQVWSFVAVRSYPRNVRHHILSIPLDRSNNCLLCQANKLIGFAGVKPSQKIEINPTISSGYAESRDGLDGGGYGPFKESYRSSDPGLTASWSVTPNMMLSAAINPDFSQVEADAAQMDINKRFPLYYSEKRPFFLEGADIFGGLTHTRTLADPDWGVKLTGKSGRNTFGMFTVRDAVTPLIFSGAEGAGNTTLSLQSQGTVVRYRRDIFKSSTVGVILTDREGTDYYNRGAALDADLRFTKTDYLSIMTGGTVTRYPGETARSFDQDEDEFGGGVYNIQYRHDTSHYNVFGEYHALTPGVRNDLAFITQTGVRRNSFGGEYIWRAEAGRWYNYLSVRASREETLKWNNQPLKRVFSGKISYSGPMQSYMDTYIEYGGHEWYQGKKYRANNVCTWVEMKPSSSTTLDFTTLIGDGIDYANGQAGSVVQVTPAFTQKFGDRISMGINHKYEALDVADGRLYTANVTNGKISYQFTKRFFARLILAHVRYDRNVERYNEENQADTDAKTRNVFTQALLSYKINPRTVFFLGYSDNYQCRNEVIDERRVDESLIQTNRAIFAKIGYAWKM